MEGIAVVANEAAGRVKDKSYSSAELAKIASEFQAMTSQFKL